MASKYDGLARIIIQNVGGKGNINNVAHCVTRLRFRLKDESLASDDVLTQTEGILQVMHSAGQYQIVIGPHVADVYDAVLAVGHLEAGGLVDDDGNAIEDAGNAGSKDPFSMLMDLISGIIQPCLGVLAAAGMVKGFLSLFTFLGLIDTTGGTYLVIYAFADGFFYFLPVVLGYTAAKKFGTSPFIGMALGIALVYPDMVNSTSGEVLGTVLSGTAFEMSYYLKFLGIPIIMPASGYTSSVVPIILSVYAATKIEKFLHSFMPSTVDFFMTPMLTCLVGAALAYLIIGPVATLFTCSIQLLFNALYTLPAVGSIIVGALVGAFWQVLVIFGLHWALIPLAIVNMATDGFDTLMSGGIACEMAQITCVLVIYLKSRNTNTKALALSSFVTGFFGTTEPAIYGITLPRHKPFIYSCIAACVAGAFAGAFDLTSYSVGYSGIMRLPSCIDPSVGGAGLYSLYIGAVAMVIAVVIAFLLTWFLWDEDKWANKAAA